ncbi:MAG: hypothetical protein ACRCYQ_15730 [Nocardioides sp.]
MTPPTVRIYESTLGGLDYVHQSTALNSDGYTPTGLSFSLYVRDPGGGIQLWRCYDAAAGRHSLSPDGTCPRGGVAEFSLGWMAPNAYLSRPSGREVYSPLVLWEFHTSSTNTYSYHPVSYYRFPALCFLGATGRCYNTTLAGYLPG